LICLVGFVLLLLLLYLVISLLACFGYSRSKLYLKNLAKASKHNFKRGKHKIAIIDSRYLFRHFAEKRNRFAKYGYLKEPLKNLGPDRSNH